MTKVTDGLEIHYADPRALKPAERNPRYMPEGEMEALKRSLETWGMVDPIIIRQEDGRVIGGHQRLEAAIDIGMARVPVVEIDVSTLDAKLINQALIELLKDVHDNHVHSHLFFIPCAPYETDADWAEFRELYYAFSRAITWGICRVKMTTFDPAPPAPLARFVPGGDMRGNVALFQDWMARQSASRHVFVIWPQGEKSIGRDTAEFLAAPPELVRSWVGGAGTVDLAPKIEDAARLPWEIVKWPWPADARWRAAERYRLSLASIPPN